MRDTCLLTCAKWDDQLLVPKRWVSERFTKGTASGWYGSKTPDVHGDQPPANRTIPPTTIPHNPANPRPTLKNHDSRFTSPRLLLPRFHSSRSTLVRGCSIRLHHRSTWMQLAGLRHHGRRRLLSVVVVVAAAAIAPAVATIAAV